MADQTTETTSAEGSERVERKAEKADYNLVADYPPKPTRREFMISWTGLAWGSFTLANVVGAAATGRFMYPNVLFEPPQQFKAGRIEDYTWDIPSETYKQGFGVWMVRIKKDVIDNRACMVALSTVCTHLGCTPNLLLAEQKIKCPCHGSGFRFSGINFEGPAPRPLERYKIFVDPVDGSIVVDKNTKFQFEKGEWTKPESFIELAAEG